MMQNNVAIGKWFMMKKQTMLGFLFSPPRTRVKSRKRSMKMNEKGRQVNAEQLTI